MPAKLSKKSGVALRFPPHSKNAALTPPGETLATDRLLYRGTGASPIVKSPVAEVSGGFASAALLAAHRALIAAASCSRRSGERLSFLFSFLGAGAFALAGFA